MRGRTHHSTGPARKAAQADSPGMRVVRVIGPGYGTGVRSRNIVVNFLGGMRASFGGKQAGYLKMIAQTRDDALEQLTEHAKLVAYRHKNTPKWCFRVWMEET